LAGGSRASAFASAHGLKVVLSEGLGVFVAVYVERAFI
jgi:hypothetical protein